MRGGLSPQRLHLRLPSLERTRVVRVLVRPVGCRQPLDVGVEIAEVEVAHGPVLSASSPANAK